MKRNISKQPPDKDTMELVGSEFFIDSQTLAVHKLSKQNKKQKQTDKQTFFCFDKDPEKAIQ